MLSFIAVIALYDHALTLSDEVALIWARKFTFVSWLFVLNRFSTLGKAILIFQSNWADAPIVRVTLPLHVVTAEVNTILAVSILIACNDEEALDALIS